MLPPSHNNRKSGSKSWHFQQRSLSLSRDWSEENVPGDSFGSGSLCRPLPLVWIARMNKKIRIRCKNKPTNFKRMTHNAGIVDEQMQTCRRSKSRKVIHEFFNRRFAY
jgi:hypothetical protein